MSWEQVPGWHDWGWLLDEVVRTAPKEAILVEIGVAFGKSLAHLIVLAAARPDLRIFGVDPWLPQDWVERDCEPYMTAPGGFFGNFLDQIRTHCPEVLERANVLRATSERAARMFSHEECHFVYLDGDHSEEAVRADIAAWLPKIAPGGMIAGHDFGGDHTGVEPAVRAAFGTRFVTRGSTWMVRP